MVDVLLGLQWGDEGKGKIVDYLAERYDVVARFQGGPNAGHTLVLNGQKFVLHTIPSGVFREGVLNLIGNGVIDPITLKREVDGLVDAGLDFLDRLFVAEKAHLILPTHRLLDALQENAKGKSKIGSTLRGIGPTYTDKIGRQGLRVGDILSSDFEKKYNQLKWAHMQVASAYPPIKFDLKAEEEKWLAAIQDLRERLTFVRAEYWVNKHIKAGRKILAEGAQGSMLDIDFGTYPFVTSSNTITAGVCTGLGVAPQQIGEVYGITKAYCTRVGGGPFPSELEDEVGEKIRQAGGEFGATTGRPRRCGWLDIPQLRYTIMLNGVTQLIMTKADILSGFEEIAVASHYKVGSTTTDEMPFDIVGEKVQPLWKTYPGWKDDLQSATSFEDFPAELQQYVNDLQEQLGVPFSMISVGPGREQLIVRDMAKV